MPLLPASDHTDGVRFFNPPAICPETAPPGRMRWRTILKWQWTRPRSDWPDRIENPTPTGDPHAMPARDTAQVTFIGHSTFLIRLPRPDGTVLSVLTDPVFSQRCSPLPFMGPKRVRAPGRALADLPPVDVVLISHAHYDHMDLPSCARWRGGAMTRWWSSRWKTPGSCAGPGCAASWNWTGGRPSARPDCR
ncbi:MBL fold metallo-hydrolase [Komagataeibacter kakiaceti]|uniref:MBL fold metallo-hydrolase n=1 Tax=Komagataeibacter kakiaceti TaxID=943261 RepID=UPI000AA66BB6|nr:MBL fold metallo-hydrolase [Komagataeibacter kakiaceti]